MKYIFLAQMEGELRRSFYRFLPYHYGPCAMEIFNDLKALQKDGLIIIENDAEKDKTRIRLANPDRAAALIEEEAREDDTRINMLERTEQDKEGSVDPAMGRLLARRAETIASLRADAASILDAYGELGHKDLLTTVYEKYPTYAKKSRSVENGRR